MSETILKSHQEVSLIPQNSFQDNDLDLLLNCTLIYLEKIENVLVNYKDFTYSTRLNYCDRQRKYMKEYLKLLLFKLDI